MADMQTFPTANGVGPGEAGTAKVLPKQGGSRPAKDPDDDLTPPIPGVIFLLGKRGHRAAGFNAKDAQAQYDASRLYVQNRIRYYSGQVKFDVIEFNSLRELLSASPVAMRGKKWLMIYVITHGSGAEDPDQMGAIFFGDKEYFAGGASTNDILDFSIEPGNRNLVSRFRSHVNHRAVMFLISCGIAAHGPEVPSAVRALFGAEGTISTPRVDVDFDIHSGGLGKPVKTDDPRHKNDLAPTDFHNDWMTLAPATQEQQSLPLPPP